MQAADSCDGRSEATGKVARLEPTPSGGLALLFCRCLHIASGLCFCVVPSVAAAAEDDVIAFKRFLSSTPCISRIVFTDEKGCDGAKRRTNVMAYRNGNFYFRELVAMDKQDGPISDMKPPQGLPASV